MKLPSRSLLAISVWLISGCRRPLTSPRRLPSSAIVCRRSSPRLRACRAFARNWQLPSSVSSRCSARAPLRSSPLRRFAEDSARFVSSGQPCRCPLFLRSMSWSRFFHHGRRHHPRVPVCSQSDGQIPPFSSPVARMRSDKAAPSYSFWLKSVLPFTRNDFLPG